MNELLKKLSEYNNLKVLGISQSKLDKDSVNFLADIANGNTKLRELDISWNEVRDPEGYHLSVEQAINQGLCFWFGPSVMKECSVWVDFTYLKQVQFSYAYVPLNINSTQEALLSVLAEVKKELK